MKSIFFVLIVTLAPFVLSNCGFEDKYYGSSISVNSPGMAVDAYETEAEINLVANCPWTSSIDYSSGDQWCTLTPSNGIGDTKIKVEMLPHNGPTRRTAIVTFRAQDELGQTISYSITQRGTAYYFDFDPTVVNNIFEIGEEAGTVVFTFFAGTSWIAEKVGTDNEWLTLNSTSGDKGDITFGMDVSQNGGTRPRNAEILFSSIEKPENTALITIRQIRTLPATVASVINNNQFTLNWNAVANVTKFDLIVKNANDKAIISTITDLPATTLTYDLTTINYGTYVGAVSLEVKSYFDNDDELYSYSLPITTHCRFDDLSGNGTVGSEYKISCARHLTNISFAKSANYKQIANIDCSSINSFTPIGDTNSPFNGKYSAQNGTGKFKIIGLSIAHTSSRASGLFGSIGNSGSISHVTLENCILSLSGLPNYSSRDSGHGILVGINSGSISHIDLLNCNVIGNTSPDNKYIIGGIVGTNFKGQVSYCTTTGGKMIISGKSTAGGIIGYSGRRGIESSSWNFPNDITSVTHCINYSMEIDGSGQPNVDGSSGVGAIGGVVGGNEFILRDCSNSAYVHGSYYSGGVLGTNSYDRTIGYSGNQIEISRCYNSGRVEGRWAAGIVAAFVQNSAANQPTTVISECINTGDIASNYTGSSPGNTENHVGGIAARNYGIIRDCYNTGNIDGKNNSNTGGICGDLYKANGGVYNCYNAGIITAGFADASGSLAGYLINGAVIKSSVYLSSTFISGIGSGQTAKLSAESTLISANDNEMKNPATFTSWSNLIWNIVSGSYPTLFNRTAVISNVKMKNKSILRSS